MAMTAAWPMPWPAAVTSMFLFLSRMLNLQKSLLPFFNSIGALHLGRQVDLARANAIDDDKRHGGEKLIEASSGLFG
jgi:hypothetical protein